MRIIIEGCDCTGKTSVVEKLANRLHCDIIRLTHDGDGTIRKYMEVMVPDNMVHDRCFISELIYPKYFCRKPKFDDTVEDMLFDLLDSYGCKVFILTASESELKKRLEARGDEYVEDFEFVKNINRDYVALSDSCLFPLVDTTGKTVDDVVNEIERMI